MSPGLWIRIFRRGFFPLPSNAKAELGKFLLDLFLIHCYPERVAYGVTIYLGSLIMFLTQVGPRLHFLFPGSLLEIGGKLQGFEGSSKNCQGNSQFGCPSLLRFQLSMSFEDLQIPCFCDSTVMC